MTRFLVATVGMVMVAGAAAMAAELEGFDKTYAQAQKQAKQSGKPMYLHFTTTWCGWCRKIEQDCYASADGKKALEKFAPASLDCTVAQGEQPSEEAKINMGLMRKYGGHGYPFLVILTPEGDLLHSWAGYKPLPDFVKELDNALTIYQDYKDFIAYADKADKKSLDFNLRAMKVYAKIGQLDKAAQAAAEVRTLDPKDEKGVAAECVALDLQAVLTGKQPDEAKLKSLLETLMKLDPDNQKGQLEKAMWAMAIRSYGQSRATRDTAVVKEHLGQAVELLSQLSEKAKKLEDPQNVCGLLGFCLMNLGRFDEAEKAFEKGLAVDPTSGMATQLKAMLERVKQAKAKLAEQKSTTAPPAPEKK